MVVCLCQGITHRDIERALELGARTPDDVGALCGAGTGCGACRDMIGELIAAGDDFAPHGRPQQACTSRDRDCAGPAKNEAARSEE